MTDEERAALDAEVATAYNWATTKLKTTSLPIAYEYGVRAGWQARSSWRADESGLVEALEFCLETPDGVDPLVADLIEEAGRRGAFGALMSSAEYAWRESLINAGYPPGGEFIVGPCRATLDMALAAFKAKGEPK